MYREPPEPDHDGGQRVAVRSLLADGSSGTVSASEQRALHGGDEVRERRGQVGQIPALGSVVPVEFGRVRGVVDIGCGQGLMASLLQAAADMQQRGRWPAVWPGSGAGRRSWSAI